MKVGIIADTHDVLSCAHEAAELFRAEGVEMIFHLGDVCAPGLLEPLAGNGARVVGVFGNNDGLLRAADGGRGAFQEGPRLVEAGGRAILMAHRFDALRGELGTGGRFDLVLFGHTHRAMTMRVGRALVLNPGEGCGLLTGRRTCAVVDLRSMQAAIVDLGGRARAAEGG